MTSGLVYRCDEPPLGTVVTVLNTLRNWRRSCPQFRTSRRRRWPSCGRGRRRPRTTRRPHVMRPASNSRLVPPRPGHRSAPTRGDEGAGRQDARRSGPGVGQPSHLRAAAIREDSGQARGEAGMLDPSVPCNAIFLIRLRADLSPGLRREQAGPLAGSSHRGSALPSASLWGRAAGPARPPQPNSARAARLPAGSAAPRPSRSRRVRRRDRLPPIRKRNY